MSDERPSDQGDLDRERSADEDEPTQDGPTQDGPTQDGPTQDGPTAEPEWRRRRRLAEVFGDVLPDTTGDERGRGDGGTSEEWLRRQVPPHHG